MQIRPETPEDPPRIDRLTRLAFASAPHAAGTEAAIVRQLRRDGALCLSLVAEEDAGHLLGHVAFSPLRIGETPGDWYGLGPLSVLPARQRQGIGRALVAEGLHRLRTLGAAGCALIGDPRVYGPMGFVAGPGLNYGGLDPAYIQYHPLQGITPRGALHFAPAFDTTEPS
ncbi:GNAT family N-acetyltransferase [Oceanicola sp. S124]|uniref:GNAT family N-acetyltransferase n=1 Tax=Oceanicola sp. S124 TaxID=1042378 RepID=UPI0002558CE5|nr:N-acetyltransferase [Oceanicola sp. S124]